ncbi:MAG: hypothetical protein WCK25_06150, partial [Actinomycetes bacterium]
VTVSYWVWFRRVTCFIGTILSRRVTRRNAQKGHWVMTSTWMPPALRLTHRAPVVENGVAGFAGEGAALRRQSAETEVCASGGCAG